MTAKETGDRGEQIALAYLEQKGYRLLYKNYRSGKHEIDLILRDGAYTVFAEVKARSGVRYGTPAEFVTAAKRRFLILAAQAYLQETGTPDAPARFDVVEVYLADGRVRHIPDAFRT